MLSAQPHHKVPLHVEDMEHLLISSVFLFHAEREQRLTESRFLTTR
jgi:hypothetical protein